MCLKKQMLNRLALLVVPLLFLSACMSPYFDQRLEDIGNRSDLTGTASVDLCDAAAYLQYDASKDRKEEAKRLLNAVLKRGDITKKEYNSALTGDAELGMSEMGATCAWGLPTSEQERYLRDGRKYTRWKYEYDDYGFDYGIIEFVNDIVVSIDTDY